jgi:hypothetical protein
MTRTRRHPAAVAVATTLTVLALAAGCTATTGQPDIAPPTPSPPTRPHSPPPNPALDPYHDPHQQAIDAYLGTQHAYLSAVAVADPHHPDLSVHTAGTALDLLRDTLASLRSRGLRGRGDATYQPAIDTYDNPDRPTKITIRDCMDTSSTELYAASGQPYEDQPGGLRLVVATVEIVDGTWKVTGLGIHGVDTCTR